MATADPFRPSRLTGDGDLFRQLIDSAPDAMVIVAEDGSIVFVNVQAEKLFGYRRDELIGQPVEVLVPERSRAVHLHHRDRYAAEPKVRSMGSGLELNGRRKDGSEFPVEISLSPLEAAGGRLVSAAIRDISERKRVEAAARLASDRLLSAIESIQGGLALYDAADRLVLCNSSCRSLFARGSEGPVVGRTFSELVGGAIAAGLFELGAEAPDALRQRLAEYHREPVGSIDLAFRDGQIVRLTDRRTLEGGIVSTLTDITADVAHEAELRRTQALAETANSAKSEFLSSMSHELRTPLNSILGFAQLLQRDKKAPLTDAQKGKLDYVLKGGEHLLRLIDDILDLSRIEAGRVMVSLEPVAIADVLSEVKAALDPMASRAGVELSVAPFAPELSRVTADRTRFSQVLINYGSNAIKYGKAGGKAVLSVAPGEAGSVRVTIRDDGMGIPLDKQDRIFQPFQRAGQETGPIQGTGIGLAITKRLAELMHGRVGFQSAEGEGSEFWVELPVPDPASAPEQRLTAADVRAWGERSPASDVTIVYIEDNASNIAFMEGLVAELEQVTLLTAPTAEVGIEIVRWRRPEVVIMDINLPGMSGYEATRKLSEWPETRDIPVIALTAAAMVGDRKRAEDAGFRRYLTKPIRVTELLSVLEELLADRLAGKRD